MPEIYQLKVTLKDVSPPVWRRILVPSNSCFMELHLVIQVAMGWEDAHLYGFRFKETNVGPRDEDDGFGGFGPKTLDDEETPLNQLFRTEKKCVYTYDFGDNWEHSVVLEKVLEMEPDRQYPVCIAGKQACPPENCGGPFGYSELLEILADPSHPEHELRREWLYEAFGIKNFDPAYFDLEEVEEILEQLRHGVPELPPPSLEQWRQLYDMAGRIKKAEPWKLLFDNCYIAVQPKDQDERVYYVTMGNLGECVAVAAFPGDAAMASLEKIRQRALAGASMAALGEQDCIMCYFGDREEVEQEDREVMRQLGIRFRGRGQWIYFRAMKPGFAPWFLTHEDAAILCNTMEQYLAAFEDWKNSGTKVNFENGEALLRGYTPPPGAKGWSNQVIKLPPFTYQGGITEITDELYIARLKKCKKTKKDLELDIFYMPAPIQEFPTDRPHYPRIALLGDKKTGRIVDQRLLDVTDNIEIMILDLLGVFTQRSGLPRSLQVRDDELAAVVSDWCDKLGVKLVLSPVMPTVDEGIGEMLDLFSGMMGEF